MQEKNMHTNFININSIILHVDNANSSKQTIRTDTFEQLSCCKCKITIPESSLLQFPLRIVYKSGPCQDCLYGASLCLVLECVLDLYLYLPIYYEYSYYARSLLLQVFLCVT